MVLTQKEASLIKELREQELLCIDKYSRSAAAASDTKLRDLFADIEQIERTHLSTLEGIDGSSPSAPPPASRPAGCECAAPSCDARANDKYLCTDALAAEKHASSLYDTCIFEFRDDNVRDQLNHIQKEEQQHGKRIYDYMSANMMY